jgi:integrase
LVWGEWAEVDWEAREWRLPPHKMKNGKPHIVPLARQVYELLRELHKYTGASGFMFPSWGSEGHLSAMSLRRSVRDAGYGAGVFSPHGFRHMAVTLLKELEFPHDAIYLQLSHTLERSAAKAAYDKAQILSQRAAMMQAYADYLDSLREHVS